MSFKNSDFIKRSYQLIFSIGNKELRVPKLNPLILPHVEQTSSNIKFSIDDVKIDGCQTLKMTSAT